MLGLTLPGLENGFPTNGNGNMLRKEPSTTENTRGEISGDPMQCLCQIKVEPCVVLTKCTLMPMV